MSVLLSIAVSKDVEDGPVLVFEADRDDVESDLVLASEQSPGRVIGRVKESLDQALEQIRPALASVTSTLAELGPAETEIEFGLKLGGETGVILSKGTAEVNFVVRMKW